MILPSVKELLPYGKKYHCIIFIFRKDLF